MVQTDDAVRQTLLDIEHTGWVALCNGTAEAHFQQAMSDDAMLVLNDGAVLTRPGARHTARRYSSYAINSPVLLRLDDDAAVLVYEVTARIDGSPDFVAIASSVYRCRPEGWKLVLHQQTATSDGPPTS